MKRKFKVAWAWVKKNYVLVLLSLGVLFAIVGFFFCKSGVESKLALKKLELTRQKMAAARLQGQKDMLKQNRSENSEEIEKIDAVLRSIDSDITHKKAEISNLTLKQKLDKYSDLGY